MQNKKPGELSHDERMYLHADWFDHENDPGITLVELVRCAGDFLGSIVGNATADIGMKTVIGAMAGGDESSWRQDIEENESGAFSDWPMGQLLHDLSAYAHFGIWLGAEGHHKEAEIVEQLERMIGDVSSFLNKCPLETWLGEGRSPQLEDTVLLAQNRWEMDHDRSVDPEALAIFGGVKISRMRNMLSGKKPELTRVDGRIPATQARQWLDGRDSYYPSIWKTGRPSSDISHHAHEFSAPIFVPEARDGSLFHPGLERRGGFTVGVKGEEKQVADFDTALLELQKMPTPSWRRPGERGSSWGIVRGVTWTRASNEELNQLAQSDNDKTKLAQSEGL